ncbi:hypothetical protein F5Y15DRAFT_115060 [Xylariaceae sp. FL0016]|nr:hypothetical protein F5Y15DRAFT_115060 [Xylariaceae sp. FL0016]
MTENQCWSIFNTSRATLVPACRRACEAALEKSRLLITRDMTVLQSFLLYIVARGTEDTSGAVWILVALAVRIAKVLYLHVNPDQEKVHVWSYFEKQMRKRLWLTICHIDLRTSFGQASEPLISFEEASAGFSLPHHVNDSDFGTDTPYPVSGREGLTDVTYALITYHGQLGGRLLNFPPSQRSGGEPKSGNAQGETNPPDIRQEQLEKLQKTALGLLHFCDPESSDYAWFTWHATQTIVAGIRLSMLRPIRRAHADDAASRTRTEGDSQLLQLALRALKNARLMYTESRAEGFRWYATIPWHALAIAISECYICKDVELVRESWPDVETSYHIHEVDNARYSGGRLEGPLGKLMRSTREKLAPLLQRPPNSSGIPAVAHTPESLMPVTDTMVNTRLPGSPMTMLRGSSLTFDSTQVSQTMATQKQPGYAFSLASPIDPVMTTGPCFADPAPPWNIPTQSWGVRDEFVSEMSLDSLDDPARSNFDGHIDRN